MGDIKLLINGDQHRWHRVDNGGQKLLKLGQLGLDALAHLDLNFQLLIGGQGDIGIVIGLFERNRDPISLGDNHFFTQLYLVEHLIKGID